VDAFGLHIVARNSLLDNRRARDLLLGYLSGATGADLREEVRRG
jgi:hypothetical protein